MPDYISTRIRLIDYIDNCSSEVSIGSIVFDDAYSNVTNMMFSSSLTLMVAQNAKNRKYQSEVSVGRGGRKYLSEVPVAK